MALDQVGDGLGVGLGAEGVPVGLEPRLELAVVLDDPVQDDRHRAVLAAGQRMRVPLGDRAVSGPAGVAEARGRLRAPVRRRGLLEVREVADRPHVVQAVRLEQRDAGRVVASVLETLQTVEQQRLNLLRPDVSDDPAHAGLLLAAVDLLKNAESPTAATLHRAGLD